MRLFVFSLLLLLLVGVGVSCRGVSPSTSTPTEVELQAPELDVSAELEALEPILPDLGEIDVGSFDLPVNLFDTIEVEADVSPSLTSFDLSLPTPE